MNLYLNHPLLGQARSRPKRSDRIQGLTGRQAQVLRGICYGWPEKRIALELGISPKTVCKFRGQLNSQVPNHSTPALIHWAFKNNILDIATWLTLPTLPS